MWHPVEDRMAADDLGLGESGALDDFQQVCFQQTPGDSAGP
jgi:hypothetical protein